MDKEGKTSGSKITKSMVPKPTRMPYINFVQAFRNSHPGEFGPKEMISEAAAAWRQLSDSEKKPFVDLAATQKAKQPRQKKVKRLRRRRADSEYSYY
ncbi:uncharacterized protein LOC128986639 [Macrosteles quadrilineatus]|uniref:uncharacterized protein LOC128986639 n=1 Tax=Macrosteles quadrilineatus TaxID=74068 RepID=UPI0023E1C5A2|nr:uncharacterized protein LOC128986639 [Macrosteles quadrilineatus]